MEAFILTVLAAVVATMVMLSVMYALVWEGFEHGDMIRMLGHDVTKDPHRFLTMGFLVYLGTGLAVSWLYYLALSFLELESIPIAAGFGGAIGVAQGFILMNFYIVELGSMHQDEKFNRHWLPVSFAHWFGHGVYGVSMGSMLGSFFIFGLPGFFTAALLSLGFTGLVTFFARKKQISTAIRARAHRTTH